MKNILAYKIKNKYVVLVGVLLAQLTIAGIYAWSALGVGLQGERGWSDNAIILPYAIAQTVFALSTILSGRLLERKGPRFTMVIGGILYGGGLILSGLVRDPNLLNITYGGITGMGIGFIYVCPLAILIKWFPKHKGLVTGLSVAVFASGSILYKEIIAVLLQAMEVSTSFMVLGVFSVIFILLGAMLTNDPEHSSRKQVPLREEDLSPLSMVRTKKFKVLWLMYLFAASPGLLVLGASAKIGMDLGGLTQSIALGLITVLAITNGVSRLVFGYLADKFRPLVLIRLGFGVTLVSTIGLILNVNSLMFLLGIVGIVVGFGSFLVLFPLYTHKSFGPSHYGANYSVVYQAYGLASLLGIVTKTLVGGFSNLFVVLAIVSLLGLILAIKIESFSGAMVESSK